jgi:hypothetical protein
MTPQKLQLRSMDDYLGPSSGRFFSRGYRRAEYDVRDIAVTAATGPAPQVSAAIDIGYPPDWSLKSDIGQRPHLSTVDILVLGVQLSETHLAHGQGLDPAMRRASWVRKATLRAGSAPQEHLTGLAAGVTLRGTTPVPDAPGTSVSVYQCVIGQMQARLEIVHPTAAAGPGGTFGSLTEALGSPQGRYYGAGFTHQQHVIEDVEIDLEHSRAVAGLRIEAAEATDLAAAGGAGMDHPDGVEGALRPAPSMVDCFVVNLQLAQVLLYELDGIRRQDSNTLWMVKTVLRLAEPTGAVPQPLRVEASIGAKHLVPLRGGIWRDVDIDATCGAVSMTASFAHELPVAAQEPGTDQEANYPQTQEVAS